MLQLSDSTQALRPQRLPNLGRSACRASSLLEMVLSGTGALDGMAHNAALAGPQAPTAQRCSRGDLNR